MMMEEVSLSKFLSGYGINYLSLDRDVQEVIESYGTISEMKKVLDFLINDIGVSPKRIEKCPSILYLNPECVKKNFDYLISVGIDKEKIIGCLHVLSSEPNIIKETYEYVSRNYGVETFNKNISILGVSVDRIKEMEQFSNRMSNNAILSVAITSLRPGEVGTILSICEEFGVEVSGSFFQKGVSEITEIVKICKENNLEVSGSMFRKSSSEIRKTIAVCREKGVPVTGSVFLKDSNEVSEIIDTCRKYNIPITGSVFRRDAKEIDDIVTTCSELGIPVSGTVFLRTADEIRRIHAVCSEYKIEISANIFKKSALEIEDIAKVCQKYGLDVTSTLFKKNASSLDKSIGFVLDNYGRSYMTPLIVINDANQLKRVFPYLDSKGILPAVVNSPAILSLKFDEILEREKLISIAGEEDVVKGRVNPIYGLSRKRYNEKKKEYELKGVVVK